jgi:pimeloyl-ACP methyl ester carboxylesterase
MTRSYPSGATVRTVENASSVVTVSDSAPGGEPDKGQLPIVLVHGTGGTTATDFWALYPMFTGVRRTIGLDLDPGQHPEVNDLAAQISHAVRTVASTPVHLVGYSLGAVLAAAATAIDPGLYATLTLINGWRRTDRHQSVRNSAWRQLLLERSRAYTDLTLATAHSALFLRNLAPHQLDEVIARRAARRDPRAELELNARIDISTLLPKISIPTLVIGSTYDVMVPIHHSRELFGAIDNARYLELASGHAATTERPAEIFGAIEDFVRDPGAVGAGSVIPSFQA